MSTYEPYDPNRPIEKKEILVTNRLFIVSLTVYALTFIILMFYYQLGISRDVLNLLIPILIMTGFAINIAGLIKGILERKVNKELAINGIIGNLVAIILILVVIGIAIYYLQKLLSDFDFHLNLWKRN